MSLKNIIFYSAISFALLLTSSSIVGEEKVLYKKIDKNGRIIFTDKQLPGAKKVVVNTSKNVMSIPKSSESLKKPIRNASDKNEDTQNKVLYDVLAIEKPVNDEAIRANDGNLYVIVALSPMLSREHSVRLLMNGTATGPDQKVPYFSLTEIERGTHDLVAQIILDETGEVIQSSETISFHMIRTSRLQRNRRR